MDILFIVSPLVIGLILGWIVKVIHSKYHLTSLEQRARRLKQNATQEADTIKKELIYDTRELLQKEKREQDKEVRNRYKELAQTEGRLQKKEDLIDQKLEDNQTLRLKLEEREQGLAKKQEEINRKEQDIVNKLESIARLTRAEAEQNLIQQAEVSAKQGIIDTVHRIEQESIQTAERKAKEFMLGTVQRLVSDVTAEMTVSTVGIPSDDMKGRIIGKKVVISVQ